MSLKSFNSASPIEMPSLGCVCKKAIIIIPTRPYPEGAQVPHCLRAYRKRPLLAAPLPVGPIDGIT